MGRHPALGQLTQVDPSQLASLEASKPALVNREYKVDGGTLKPTSIEPPKEKWPRQQVVHLLGSSGSLGATPFNQVDRQRDGFGQTNSRSHAWSPSDRCARAKRPRLRSAFSSQIESAALSRLPVITTPRDKISDTHGIRHVVPILN